jgi:hypothetical protein
MRRCAKGTLMADRMVKGPKLNEVRSNVTAINKTVMK